MRPSSLISAAIHRIGRRYWKSVNEEAEVLLHRKARPFQHFAAPDGPPAFAAMISARANEEHEEYIHRIMGGALICPSTGFIIRGSAGLVLASLPNSELAQRPPLAAWALRSAGIYSTLKLDRCISLRDVFEGNYFHFFHDVLTRIPMLKDAGVLDAPVVIGRDLYRTAFFQAVLPLLQKAGLQVIDQGNRSIESQEIIYCKPMPYDRALLDRVLDLLEVPRPRGGIDRKVFLMRAAGSRNARTLANAEEVAAVVEEFGYEIHDPAKMALAQQMELLGGTRDLIGIHGAGLTNMIFRRGAPLNVLEIFPADQVPPHYHWLSRMFGYQHRVLLGSATSASGSFTLPAEELRHALRTGSSTGAPGSPPANW